MLSRTQVFLLAAAAVTTVSGQDNSSYVDYNTEPQPNLFPETLALPLIETPDCSSGPLSKTLVCNTSAAPADRAAALISLFTLEELVNHTVNTIPTVPRLGLPGYQVWSESLHGLDHYNDTTSGEWSWSTSFPQAILTSASLNRTLFNKIGDIIATQARAFNNDGRYGLDGYDPNINGFRSPVWGRGQETPGEDTFCLSSIYAYEYITGLQGGVSPDTIKIAATAKHFAGYDIDNWNNHSRLGNDVYITQQDLADYYMPSFRAAVQDARVQSIMCSYNAVNGVPSCANSYFLNTLLRDTWNFVDTGYVSSDCDAVYVIWNPHAYAANLTVAAADGILAGCDINCGQTYADILPASIEAGEVSREDVERSVIRLYSTLTRAGYFNGNDTAYRNLGWPDVVSTDALNVSYEAAVQGMVLLKNDDTLPLTPSITSLAIIGPFSNATTQMQGNYYGPAPYLISPYSAFTESKYTVNYAFGTNVSSTSTAGFSAAISAAEKSDAVVFIGGIDNSIEAEGVDRQNITWPGNQLELIAQLAKLGKPVAVIVMGGGQIDSSALKSNPNVSAILWAGYPGQSGGKAMLDIVSGVRAPAGRLTATQYPAEYVSQFDQLDMALRPKGSNPGQTYAWYTGSPVYTFGHGLFYTTFSISAGASDGMTKTNGSSYDIASLLSQSHPGYSRIGQMPLLNFTASVRNSGTRTSDYSAMLFARTADAGPAPYSNKWLVGFDRLAGIAAGESQMLEIPVPLEMLTRVDEIGRRVLYPGTYDLVLNNEEDIVRRIILTGGEEVLEDWPAWEQQVGSS